ncbi:MAG: cysteine desulfurase [Spirochaetes bacterium]|nr:cysteine desulfurase [Spirochaetota bacterium]
MKTQKRIYLDNNATTKVDDRVIKHMTTFFRNDYAVASSQFSHTPGIKAKNAVSEARHIISQKINSKTDEIIFTSGATEANNLAIKGTAAANKDPKRKKIIISRIEDFSVLNSAKNLERSGYTVQQVNVDNEGFVDMEHLRSLVDEKTLLVSIIYGNHEIGTIQDIKAISKITSEKGALLHSNAAAVFMQKPIDISDEGIDLLSISSHKIHGPKGVGALFVKKETPVKKILDGGFQEFDLRPGTENVPGIAGFGKAVEIFSREDLDTVSGLRALLYKQMRAKIKGIKLNGPEDFSRRIPNNLNLSFDYVEGESIVLHLDMRGIAVITGSACFSRALQASHILMALGFTHERAHSSIRFSLSKYLKETDINYSVKNTKEVVDKLRELSPLKKVEIKHKEGGLS